MNNTIHHECSVGALSELQHILAAAGLDGASDVHIITGRGETTNVWFRKEKSRIRHKTVDTEHAETLIRAAVDAWETKTPVGPDAWQGSILPESGLLPDGVLAARMQLNVMNAQRSALIVRLVRSAVLKDNEIDKPTD